MFLPLSKAAMNRDLAKMQPTVVFDKDNNAVWLRVVRNSKVKPVLGLLKLILLHDDQPPKKLSDHQLMIREACTQDAIPIQAQISWPRLKSDVWYHRRVK